MFIKPFLLISIAAAFLLISGCTVPSKNLERSPMNVSKIEEGSVCDEKFVSGDGVRIRLPLDSNSFLHGIYAIDKNGYINLPIIGKYKVVSVSPAEFMAYIQKNYEQYLKYPEVQVTPLIRISLLGGFVHPGLYYVDPKNSLWDIISMAGGTIHEKGWSKIRWERNRKQINSIDLVVALEKGQSLEEIGFKSGDQIITPNDPKSLWDILFTDIFPAGSFGLSLYMITHRHY